MNLERRARWHYELNMGFVPILETPNGYTILESRIIMDFLENAFPNKGAKLYLDDPYERAVQHMIMATMDEFQAKMFHLVMSRGAEEYKNVLEKVF